MLRGKGIKYLSKAQWSKLSAVVISRLSLIVGFNSVDIHLQGQLRKLEEVFLLKIMATKIKPTAMRMLR